MEQLMKNAEKLARLKKYPEAFEMLKEAESEGYPMASYAIGTWYLHGKHVKKDIKKAVQYLTKASKGDIKEAFFDLGICYEKGVGTEKNLEKAFLCYLRASHLGDKDAMYEVVRCLYYGIGTKKNKDLAALIHDNVFNLNKHTRKARTNKLNVRSHKSNKIEYSF